MPLVTWKRSLYYQWCLLTDSRWLKPLFLRSFSKLCGLLLIRDWVKV
ncbi:hypothetical protein COO91_01019 [Nostoc flagelliforme CCNUN1]|uniref:Uncharacterized protein n=1 Tax=Nostoc flagelliforme CCNUN1 TaxID=2038116 RepID=A0A2K8SI69_9NOSO|nr:hypothetical protein COO91_01019 [Nostoc flagelliforme CCNUN1]